MRAQPGHSRPVAQVGLAAGPGRSARGGRGGLRRGPWGAAPLCLIFISRLELTLSVTLHQFQVHSGVSYIYVTHEVAPRVSLVPRDAVTVALTVSPVLHGTAPRWLCNCQLPPLDPFPVHPAPSPPPTGLRQFVLCIDESVSILFAGLFCSLDVRSPGVCL